MWDSNYWRASYWKPSYWLRFHSFVPPVGGPTDDYYPYLRRRRYM